jgi:serine/threonine protein kinase
MKIDTGSHTDYLFKLGDFGIAQSFTSGARLTEFPGLGEYMAPELDKNDYDYRVDLYNLGYVMYELSKTLGSDVKNIDFSLYDLHTKLRNKSPKERPGLGMVLDIASTRLEGGKVTPVPGVIARIMEENTKVQGV